MIKCDGYTLERTYNRWELGKKYLNNNGIYYTLEEITPEYLVFISEAGFRAEAYGTLMYEKVYESGKAEYVIEWAYSKN